MSNDPWYNLALEEHLLKKVKKKEIILYLWQNNNTIVIGRNENPWKECRCKNFEEIGGKIARRLSGGGAVFHDLGNLNFTFVMDKNLDNLDTQLKVILNAVNELGITANFSGRNDIVVGLKNFAGDAF
ncbi:MAG: lipoate--protein ligase, partial [Clostridiaceae bacterium]